MRDGDIIRNGFSYSYGRFYAPVRVERIEGARLRAMFLPRLTAEANRLLRDHRDSFVRGQLLHYGVEYDKNDFSGNGTMLLKKLLQAGKCDKVPADIEELRSQMHKEWLATLTEDQLSGNPECVMERYFVDSTGSPDPTKTSDVVGITFPYFSGYRAGQLREAVNRLVVDKAAKNHGAIEKGEAEARERERASRHEAYLADARNPESGSGAPSPVGEYIVDSEDIESNWPESAQDMTLSVHETNTPGIYQANFDFGVAEGVMMLGTDERLLGQFCKENEYSEDDFHDEETLGSKRKGSSSMGVCDRRRKRAKAGGRPGKYFVRLKSRDTGISQIFSEATAGTIHFGGPGLSSFKGEVNIKALGEVVDITARKVSAVPQGPEYWESWSSYSDAASERARVGRWGGW
ncbi:hypothetical protein N658DRAFT_486301 [Parathielavia hyrcaniae]|uniref:Uncharacterized protein n=1 Tax=Parathielavia hyrcaniae TaxID=113614 RepID=A0AAN6Q5C8_9PEZI|nr:hypothetical protein N658DRAFT_486301 [Parathielavia hyrcaniae]